MRGVFGIIPGMREELKPTLWRTARALANPDRLRLMRLVAAANGKKGVSELADEAGLPVPTTSMYLRALNARGLISVVRSGPYVYYGTESNRSLPVAIDIQKSFRRLFKLKKLPKDWVDRLMPVLRAYSNPRREEMIRMLAANSPLRYAEFLVRSGLCETSFLRHLGILESAGIVMRVANGEYSLAKSRNSLEAVFLSAAGDDLLPPHLYKSGGSARRVRNSK